jgi:cytochrome P450
MTHAAAVPVHLRRHGLQLAPELAVLRAQCPVGLLTLPNGNKAWLVSDYAHVREVLTDAARFANDGRFIPDPYTGRAVTTGHGTVNRHGDITTYDPPEHSRLRRMITSALTMKRIAALRPRVEQIVHDALQAMAAHGSPADLVQAFALRVPSMVICELLGVPYADREGFQLRATTRFDTTLPDSVRIAAVRDSLIYMAELVASQRVAPTEGLLGGLIRDHGDEIDDRELAGVGDILLLGGHETTANVLALGSLLLLTSPQHQDAVRDEQRLPGLVEELLRYLSVVQTGVPRVATMDTELGGRPIRRGERVLCSLPSANRDNALAEHLEVFDPDRRTSAHLAFGHGIHYCLGAHLARLELRVAFPALLEFFPSLRLDVPIETIAFRSASAVYGLDRLPVRW